MKATESLAALDKASTEAIAALLRNMVETPDEGTTVELTKLKLGYHQLLIAGKALKRAQHLARLQY